MQVYIWMHSSLPLAVISNNPCCPPLCLKVVRATPNNSTKTPLSLLNEFAARLCLDVVFTEEADTQAGPFTVTAALQGRGGATGYIHAKGTGRVSSHSASCQWCCVVQSCLHSTDVLSLLKWDVPRHLTIVVQMLTTSSIEQA
jgi:hypothetical protein